VEVIAIQNSDFSFKRELIVESIFGGFIFVLILFLFGREIFCWYFKINKTIAVLERIESEIKYLNDTNVAQ